MHIILKEGWENKEFISTRTEGFEALKKEVEIILLRRSRNHWHLEGDLRGIAEIYCQGQKEPRLCHGITQHITGTENVLSLANLAC